MFRMMMVALSFICLLAFAGCSCDDCPSCPDSGDEPDPLARIAFWHGGGTNSSAFDSVQFKVSYPDSPGSPVLFDGAIHADDAGGTVAIHPDSSASYAAFLDLLRNGNDESIERKFTWGAGTNVSSTYPESLTLYDVSVPNVWPDLRNQAIDRILIQVNEAHFESPGSDPAGNGHWVDFTVNVEVLFFGPEGKGRL